MDPALTRLLFGVLFLVLFQFILDALELEGKAKKILWVIAIILAVSYIFLGRFLPIA